MAPGDTALDVAIVGGGLAGIVALAYARRAGLDAVVLEKQAGVGGLWRELPAWQGIQISAADWRLGDLPLEGTTQPHILSNIEAWVDRFDLADGIRLNCPVRRARTSGSRWELMTPQGMVRARYVVAATGAHNLPAIPRVARTNASVPEFHSGTFREPNALTDRVVLVVGGGASAFDLLDLCFQHGARRVVWAHRGLRWFMPTQKPKHIAGSIRGFARLQASGATAEQQTVAIGAELRARYEKFGIRDIMPARDFDVRRDQLIPGRPGMLRNFADIERHHAEVASIDGPTVTLSNGHRIEPDLLLWGTGYGVDLSYFELPAIASLHTVEALAARCGGVFRSLDAPNLFFPAVGLDGIGSASWYFSLLFRSIMSHIRGTARLTSDLLGYRLNHFELVDFLAAYDPASFPPDQWRSHYRDLALSTPDDQPYPIP